MGILEQPKCDAKSKSKVFSYTNYKHKTMSTTNEIKLHKLKIE